MNHTLLGIRASLTSLHSALSSDARVRAREEWGGAGVCIVCRQPKPGSRDGFYAEPRYVVTRHSLELSWLFESLRDIFANAIDGCTKTEFYGRLANAANRTISGTNDSGLSAVDLLQAVTSEAVAILDEMEAGRFQFLSVAVGNTIADDFRNGD